MANAQLMLLSTVGGMLPPGAVSVGDTWEVVVPSTMNGIDADMTGAMTVTAIDGDLVNSAVRSR